MPKAPNQTECRIAIKVIDDLLTDDRLETIKKALKPTLKGIIPGWLVRFIPVGKIIEEVLKLLRKELLDEFVSKINTKET